MYIRYPYNNKKIQQQKNRVFGLNLSVRSRPIGQLVTTAQGIHFIIYRKYTVLYSFFCSLVYIKFRRFYKSDRNLTSVF